MPLQEMCFQQLYWVLLINPNDVHMYIVIQRTSTLNNMPNVFVPIVPEVYTSTCAHKHASSTKSTLETNLTKGHSTQPHWPMDCKFEQACVHLPPGLAIKGMKFSTHLIDRPHTHL
jgi:hypothetical protein